MNDRNGTHRNETVTRVGEFNLLGLDRGSGQSTAQCLL
jgi:hypothetical protein